MENNKKDIIDPNNWISFKEYIESRFKSLEATVEGDINSTKESAELARQGMEYRLNAIKEATELARLGMERRLDAMNEFRSTLKDQADKFLTRGEHELQSSGHDRIHSGLAEDIRILRESRTGQDIKLTNIDKESTATANNIEKRLESMNEFRSQLKDQASTFITRTEHEALIGKYDGEIRDLRDFQKGLEGKASQSSLNITMAISILGFFIGVIGIIIGFFGK
jgi:hypothetical protein